MRLRRLIGCAPPMNHRYQINLKPHRKRSSFTQEELAFLLGIKQHSVISRYETGERHPTLRTALAYRVLFGCEVDKLFPALEAEVRSQVAKRAQLLSQQISRGRETRKTAYKLKKLEPLKREVPGRLSNV